MPLVQEARILTRHFTKLGRGWVFTAGAWGGAGSAILLYLTDWKVIMANVPFVNKKFDHEIPK